VDNDLVKWQKIGQFLTRVQGPKEVVDEYAASLRKIGQSMGSGDDVIRHAFTRGLQGHLRGHVIQSNATTLEDLVKAARVAEVAASDTQQSTTTDAVLNRVLHIRQQNAAELKRLSAQVAATAVNMVDRSTPPTSRSPTPGRRVTFVDNQSRAPRQPDGVAYTQQFYQPSTQQPSMDFRGRLQRQQIADVSRRQPTNPMCQNCGGWRLIVFIGDFMADDQQHVHHFRIRSTCE